MTDLRDKLEKILETFISNEANYDEYCAMNNYPHPIDNALTAIEALINERYVEKEALEQLKNGHPMGVSQWKYIGEIYGYWDYFTTDLITRQDAYETAKRAICNKQIRTQITEGFYGTDVDEALRNAFGIKEVK